MAVSSALRSCAHPFLRAVWRLSSFETAAGRLQHRAEHRAGIADDAEVDVAILADRAVVHVDLHQRRLV